MSEIMSDIGKYLNAIRKSRKENLEDVAKAIGKSISALSRYENGQSQIDLKTLELLSRHYAVDLALGLSFPMTEENAAPKSNGGASTKLYLYYNDIKSQREIVSFLSYKEGLKGEQLLMFYDLKNIDDLSSCRGIYTGSISGNTIATQIQVENLNLEGDKIFVILSPQKSPTGEQVGILSCSLEKADFAPMATKCLLTNAPRKEPIGESVANISSSEFRKLKKTNQLIIKQSTK